MASVSPVISHAIPEAPTAPAPDSSPGAIPEPTWPDPPRYWWLKRLTLASLLLAVFLTGLRLAWGWEARRRLTRELAPVIAAGDPLSAAETDPTPVPDDKNGALVFRKAFAAIHAVSPSSSSLTYNDYLPLPPRWHTMEDESIRTNGDMLRAVRQARGYTRFDWGVKLWPPAFGASPPQLSRSHLMSNLLRDAALHAHVHGDDVEAIERIRDALHLAAAIGSPPTTPQVHMLRVYSIEVVALYHLQIITPGLTIAPPADDDAAGHAPLSVPSNAAIRPAPRPAMRSQVRALIFELLDERDVSEGLRGVYAGERATQLEMAESFARRVWVLRPMFELDAIRVARIRAAFATAAASPDWPDAKSTLAHEPLLWRPDQTTLWSTMLTTGRARPATERPIDYGRILSTDVCVTPSLSRAIEYDMKARAERRLSATALAVRLYQVDHDGRFPPSLEALVPQYLPSVPADPFNGNGKPLRYVILPGALPGGGDRLLVYSVGMDGTDDTGKRGAATVPAVPCFSYVKGPDVWVDLVRWAPPLTPEQQAAEDAAEKAARQYDQ